jgi:formate hydrogenlyase subunit 4
MGILEFLLAFFVFPGFIFAIVIGLLFEGIDRKIAAHMQNRIGPPVWQPFLDIGKLFGKEDINPKVAQRLVFILAPFIAFGAVIVAMFLLPVNSAEPTFGFAGDLLVLIYLLNIPAVCMILGGYSSGSPFGTIGSSRYIVQLLGYELAFILAALTAASMAGSLGVAEIAGYQAQHGWLLFNLPFAGIVALLAAPGKLMKVPFDIPEAETEIVHGALTEYSGGKLAVFRLAYNIENLAVAGFITALFLGGPISHSIGGLYIPGVVGFFIKTLLVILLMTLIRCIMARVRIDQALKFYWFGLSALALLNLVMVM